MFLSQTKNTIPVVLNICINKISIRPQNSVKPLGITLDNKLDFEGHISSICKSVNCQLNVVFKVKNFVGFNKRKV